MTRVRLMLGCLVFLASMVNVSAAGLTDSLKKGTPTIQSISAMAFGPEGILFVADPASASVFALDTQDRERSGNAPIKLDDLGNKLASLLGTTPEKVRIADLKVNPASGNAYLGVMRGNRGAAILKVDRNNQIEELKLDNIPFAAIQLENLTDQRKQQMITGLGYIDGKVLVSGLSNQEWAAMLKVIPFPFKQDVEPTGVEIFHGAHGKFETNSPIRTFTPYTIEKEPHVLAAYTCTPLVKFPLKKLQPGKKLRGVTIAELGNRNRPLDMVVYQQDGKAYVLIANSARGVMKVTTEEIDSIKGIEQRIRGTAGLKYETVADLQGVQQLDKLDDGRALILVKAENGELSLETVALP